MLGGMYMFLLVALAVGTSPAWTDAPPAAINISTTTISPVIQDEEAFDPILDRNCPKTCTCTLREKKILSVNYCTMDPLQALPKLLHLYPNTKELVMCGVCLSQIPTQISILSQLVVLKVKQNSIEFIPNEVFTLPKLTVFDLSRNKIRRIPSKMATMPELTNFNIGYNKLDMLPTEFSVMKFRHLILSGNEFREVPKAIFSMKWLKTLELTSNKIRHISSNISSLARLEKLHLSDNNISDIPDEISSLKSLTDLILGTNRIEVIPRGIWKLSNLRCLDLGNNTIVTLSKEIANMKMLFRLKVDHNQIAGVPNEIGQLPRLSQLHLSYNQLKFISLGIFSLLGLKELYLRDNRIQIVPHEISRLAQLTRLDLSHNEITTVPVEIVELSELQLLNMGFNKLLNLPSGISNMSNLTNVDASYNSLTSVPHELFKLPKLQFLFLQVNNIHTLTMEVPEVSQLKYLNLSSNELSAIPIQLCELSQLETLVLSHNALSTVPCSLPDRLTLLDLSHNRIHVVPCHLSHLHLLGHLYLDHNYIKALHCNLKALSYLSVLKLDHNVLESVPCEVSGMRSLSFLHLDHNQIQRYPKSCLKQLPILLFVNLNSNKLDLLSQWAFEWLGNTREIYLSNNVIKTTAPGVFSIGCYGGFRRIELINNGITSLDSWPLVLSSHNPGVVIDMRNNSLSNFTNFAKRFFASFQYNTTFKFQNNQISHFMDIFEGWNMKIDSTEAKQELFDSMTFDLQGNPLICDCIDFEIYKYFQTFGVLFYRNLICTEPKSLEGKNPTHIALEAFVCLITKHCPIGCTCTEIPHYKKMQIDCESYNSTVLPSSLPDLPRKDTLYHIDISNQNLEKIGVTKYLSEVSQLVLSNNSITNLDMKFFLSFKELEVIQLDNNKLQYIPESIKYISNVSIVNVKLGNNPWVCDCKASTLVNWIISNKEVINDTDSITCGSPHTMKSIKLVDIDTLMLCAQQNMTGVYIVTILAAVSFAAFIYVGIKDKLKYFRWRLFGIDECDGEGKEFDVFVSYADDDEEYVGEYLIPQLEMRGFKVCFHHVHFHGGKPIHVNIYECIEKSKRMLIYFSKHFYESKFSMFEFHAAHDLDIRNGTRRLLSIKDENLDMDQFDISVRSYFKTHTYIRRNDENFWKNLVYTLPRNRLGVAQI